MAKSKKKWPVIAGIAFMLIFLGAMAWSTLGNARYKCQVCITFNGQSLCRDGAATTKAEAERVAADGICSDLGHGLTEIMQCQQNAPRQIAWKQ
jgi:hypothetical protein